MRRLHALLRQSLLGRGGRSRRRRARCCGGVAVRGVEPHSPRGNPRQDPVYAADLCSSRRGDADLATLAEEFSASPRLCGTSSDGRSSADRRRGRPTATRAPSRRADCAASRTTSPRPWTWALLRASARSRRAGAHLFRSGLAPLCQWSNVLPRVSLARRLRVHGRGQAQYARGTCEAAHADRTRFPIHAVTPGAGRHVAPNAFDGDGRLPAAARLRWSSSPRTSPKWKAGGIARGFAGTGDSAGCRGDLNRGAGVGVPCVRAVPPLRPAPSQSTAWRLRWESVVVGGRPIHCQMNELHLEDEGPARACLTPARRRRRWIAGQVCARRSGLPARLPS